MKSPGLDAEFLIPLWRASQICHVYGSEDQMRLFKTNWNLQQFDRCMRLMSLQVTLYCVQGEGGNRERIKHTLKS